MKAKLIPFEPYITLLTNKDIFFEIFLNRKSNLDITSYIQSKYVGENLDYIEQHSLIIKDTKDYIYQFKNSLIKISENIFNVNSKIEDVEIYKNLTSYIEQNILFTTYLTNNNYPNWKVYNEISFYNIPNFLNNLYETHMHGEVALRFEDLIEFLIQNLHPILKELHHIYKKIKKGKIKDYINDLIYISNLSNPTVNLDDINIRANFYKIFSQKGINIEKHYTTLFSYKDFLGKTIPNILSFDKDIPYSSQDINKYFMNIYSILALNDLHISNIDTTKYKGLKFFSKESFRSSIRKAFTDYVSSKKKRTEKSKETFEKFFNLDSAIKGYEIRISLEKAQLYKWSKVYIKSFNKQQNSKKYGIVLHYKKLNSPDEFLKIKKEYKELFKKTKNFCSDLNREKNLAKYLIGIDAASIELWTPPWFFATAFKFWRYFAKYFIHSFKNRKLGFTFHAGEDFVDTVTGLKNIYEAIYFLDLQKGDRIGHGLAAGLLIDRYSLKYEITSVYPIYYFFNLLWLNHLTFKYPEKFFKYENGIYMELLKFLEMPLISNKTLIQLIEEYLKNSTYELQIFLVKFYENLGYDPINIGNDSKFESLWRKASKSNLKHESLENIFIKLFKDIFTCFKKQKNMKRLKITPLFLENSNFSFSEQVEILNLIQNIILEDIIKREIVIEACPSSNVYLYGFRSYKDHPILNKWKEYIENNTLKVTINTDNPLVSNTNLLLEYLLIYNNLSEENNNLMKNILNFSKKYTFLNYFKES